MSTSIALLHDPQTYVTGVPYDLLAELRREPGAVFVAEPPVPGFAGGPGYLLVLRYADVRAVLADPVLFSSHLGGTQIRDPADSAALQYVRRMMLNMDPPEHSRLRKPLAAAFTPRAVRELERGIERHAEALVERMVGGDSAGECDFAKDVAADLPLRTLADVLGIPMEDRWLLFDWSNRVIGFQDPDYATSAAFDPATGTSIAREAARLRPRPGADGSMPDPRTRAGMPDLYAYAHLLGDRKRTEPGTDVMSILMSQVLTSQGDTDEGADEGDRPGVAYSVSIAEFENMFWLFAVAGNETLRNGLPGGMIALLEHPEQQRLLRAEPALLDAAVDEMLRWWTPVMTFRRTAVRPASIAGQHLESGTKVVVSFASANRDETKFADPDAFDIRRYTRPGSPRHLVFGYGPHFCLGAHLARTQMRCLFGALLRRTSWVEPAGPPALLRSNFQRGVKRLPIRWKG